MSDEDELEKWRRERGIPDEEMQRLFSPELRMLYVVEKLTERVVSNEEAALQRDERTQQNIEFIIRQQAQFSADLQQSREDFRERWARADERWARTEESIRALLAIAQSHEEEMNTLREAQERTDRQMAETDRRMAETDRRMAETDERLNALINFVERRASGENGGGSEAREG